jgi:hypothetical protein
MDDCISIRIYLNSNYVDSENINKWFEIMRLFQPIKVKSKNSTKGKFTQLNLKKLYSYISSEVESKNGASLLVVDDINTIGFYKGINNNEVVSLSCNLSYDIYEQYKANIIKTVDEYMQNYHGIVAYACSLEDMFWQENEDIEMYRIKGKEMKNIHTKQSDVFPDEKIVDVEYNPGHSHIVDGTWFGSCWTMWFGDKYYKFIPRHILDKFDRCYENKALENNCLRITLHENVGDYNKTENRDRQLEFRNTTAIDYVAHNLQEGKDIKEISPAIEIETGTFENEGSRLIRYYLDESGDVVIKRNAKEVLEYKLNKIGEVIQSVIKKL